MLWFFRRAESGKHFHLMHPAVLHARLLQRADLRTLGGVTVLAESVRWRQAAAVHSALLLGGGTYMLIVVS